LITLPPTLPLSSRCLLVERNIRRSDSICRSPSSRLPHHPRTRKGVYGRMGTAWDAQGESWLHVLPLLLRFHFLEDFCLYFFSRPLADSRLQKCGGKRQEKTQPTEKPIGVKGFGRGATRLIRMAIYPSRGLPSTAGKPPLC
jgi:hypothetical protein